MKKVSNTLITLALVYVKQIPTPFDGTSDADVFRLHPAWGVHLFDIPLVIEAHPVHADIVVVELYQRHVLTK